MYKDKNNSYSPDSITVDVSYDAFITGSCGAEYKAEIMIWLAAYCLTPIMGTGVTPYTKNEIPGRDLFVGTNAQTIVSCYSSVVQSSPMESYSGSLLSFNHLKTVRV